MTGFRRSGLRLFPRFFQLVDRSQGSVPRQESVFVDKPVFVQMVGDGEGSHQVEDDGFNHVFSLLKAAGQGGWFNH